MKAKVKITCPRCGATPNKHGKGGYAQCRHPEDTARACAGFLCVCDDDADNDSHGSYEDPCSCASCSHCEWVGEFPVPLFNPETLKGWAKTAHEAGWTPPPGWKP